MIIQAVQCRAAGGVVRQAEQGGALHSTADKQMKGDTCRGNLLTMPKRAAPQRLVDICICGEGGGVGGLACRRGGCLGWSGLIKAEHIGASARLAA